MARSIEALVEEQAHRWQLRRSEGRSESRRPVVTVSRLHGAGGGEVARRLAADLGLDLFDREIIQRIAESTHLSERVVSSLETDQEMLTDWLASIASRSYLSPVEYRYHLSRVVGALAHHGGAIILGRGAHLILGQGEALRVLVAAPLETRVRAVMEREGIGEREARRRIVSVEADRKAFLMKHFHADSVDPTAFDIVANTGVLGTGSAPRSGRPSRTQPARSVATARRVRRPRALSTIGRSRRPLGPDPGAPRRRAFQPSRADRAVSPYRALGGGLLARGLPDGDDGGAYAQAFGQRRRRGGALLREPRRSGSRPELPERVRRAHLVRAHLRFTGSPVEMFGREGGPDRTGGAFRLGYGGSPTRSTSKASRRSSTV